MALAENRPGNGGVSSSLPRPDGAIPRRIVISTLRPALLHDEGHAARVLASQSVTERLVTGPRLAAEAAVKGTIK